MKKYIKKITAFAKHFSLLIGFVFAYIILSKILSKYSKNPLVLLINNFLNYTVYKTNNIDVSFGKILLSVFLILFGFFFAREISQKIIGKILNKSNIEPSLKSSINNILYYLLIIIFSIISLNIAQIPLTILTVLGGALAIGIGFGSQNIVNNFISGLIIQFERPIKVGDIIEFENHIGEVIDIGARSTKINSTANTVLILPNNFFLDKKFINWSANNGIVRSQVSFGISNNIDLENLEKIINVFLKKQPIQQYEIFISDFNENNVIFTCVFWFKLSNPIDKLKKDSDIRRGLIMAFKGNNIVLNLPKERKDYV